MLLTGFSNQRKGKTQQITNIDRHKKTQIMEILFIASIKRDVETNTKDGFCNIIMSIFDIEELRQLNNSK